MINPFTTTKFEWEDDPQIWLSPFARSLTSSTKPVYISGNRGSGKTTILRSLSSKIILESDFLRKQYKLKHFSWFGVYLQFNRNLQFYTSALAENVNAGISNPDFQISDYEVFSKYFEVSLLASFLDEIFALELNGVIHTKGPMERRACKELEAIFDGCEIPEIRKITDFSDARRLCNKLLDIFLMRDFDYSSVFVRRVIQAFSIGRLIRFIKDYGVGSLASPYFRSGKKLQLFILVDDCESLSLEQQMAFNTYIRQLEGEAKWVVSYLSGQFNSVDTYIPNTSLTEADRDLTSLSSMGDANFTKFCERVADIRLKSFTVNSSDKFSNSPVDFSFDRFGSYSYNDLIELSLRGSQSKQVRDFRNDTERTRAHLEKNTSKGLHQSFHCAPGSTPYVEHIVLTELKLKLSDYTSKEEQRTLVKIFARKQAAAFVYVCEKVRRKPVYAGKNVAYSFGDTTIRDFLDLMKSLFEAVDHHTSKRENPELTLAVRARYFLNPNTSIPPMTQNEAIRAASTAKAESVEALLSSTEPHIAHFVKGIGYLTHQLHSRTDMPRALSTPERGVFRVNCDEVDVLNSPNHQDTKFVDLLNRMERDGFLRVLELPGPGSPFAKFRLRRRLCPHFECSPRGAYEVVQFGAHDAINLLSWEPHSSLKKWARSWVSNRAPQEEFHFGDEA